MASPREHDIFIGGGAMGDLMRAFDWSSTPVGAPASWPQSLRTALSILLESRFGTMIAWGPKLVHFYNDAYRPILGSTKHPSLGKSVPDVFPEIWGQIGPLFEGVMDGNAVGFEDLLVPLDRHGYTEECYFTFSYNPIRDESCGVGGVITTVTETTARVTAERRLRVLRDLSATIAAPKTENDAWQRAATALDAFDADLPFALVYRTDGETATLVPSPRGAGDRLAPRTAPLDATSPWPFARVAAGDTVVIRDVGARCGEYAGTKWPEPVHTALALPIRRPGQPHPFGVLIAGISPRRALDDDYRAFCSLVADQIAAAVETARTIEESHHRAEALAKIDRAKTAFFSNVSHEFRTPLTLLLAPAEEALESGDGTLSRDGVESVRRNAHRLLKLVTSVLDFARIEAGREQATYEPTNLGALTADIASTFRSAIERAGLAFEVSCETGGEPLWVDPTMWEKIVLNLLSNAFKFTFEGRIVVRLELRDASAELSVSDTGTGIPADELPRIFERFHRVEGARSRTHEGSGIGLSLVHEFARLHGGDVRVESKPGVGTTFHVRIPRGKRHLSAAEVREHASPRATGSQAAAAFVEEANRWVSEVTGGDLPVDRRHGPDDLRVLVVDDNADMRDYLSRILGARWCVETAADGEEALARARHRAPDLVVTDVMMPRLDGFGLLRALRSDASLRRIPVLMLSARAGEESKSEGFVAGVDDYLVKPFSSRELIVRVESLLTRSRARSLEEALARRLTSVFQHAPVGLAILRGPEHVYEFTNAGYLAFVGNRDVAGKKIRDALPELEKQGIFELLDHVYESGETFSASSISVTLDRGPGGAPEPCAFNLVYQPLRTDDGAVDGIIVIATEVTELANSRREAEAANRAKDEFLAILGHELRNPLAPITTALQLMRARGDDILSRERNVIERQVQHLVRLIDDLLDISRVTRGKTQLRLEPLSLGDVLGKAIEMASPLFEERAHQLAVDMPRDTLLVNADPTRLAQVFSNLLTNAAKYTERSGKIAIEVATRDREVSVSVTDNGIGISPTLLPHVFDLFVQERQSLDRSRGGLGLGLAIVKGLVTLHGGSVTAESAGLGRGSRFVVRLPLANADAAITSPDAEAPARGAAPQGRRLLLVDDNSDAADLLAESLRLTGFDVRTAADGPSALRIVESWPPDIALLDIGLPVMDGFELARRLRADRRLAEMRLIAVTGYGQASDRLRSRDAGFEEHLVKPIAIEEVVAALAARPRS